MGLLSMFSMLGCPLFPPRILPPIQNRWRICAGQADLFVFKAERTLLAMKLAKTTFQSSEIFLRIGLLRFLPVLPTMPARHGYHRHQAGTGAEQKYSGLGSLAMVNIT